MRAPSLAVRSYGAQFAAFERELIFDRPHAGWARSIGRREIVLGKSPFSEHVSPHPYVLPEDLAIPEGAFVELTVGRLRRERPSADIGTGDVRFSREYYPVEAVRIGEVPLPKPYLSPDEFRARLVVDWCDAESDQLDYAIALQLLSCPRDVYGIGGIGSQSFSMSSARSPLDQLRRTIARQLPREFTRPNPRYEFEFIQSKSEAETLVENRTHGRTEEMSYNFLRVVDPRWAVAPIQIPTILHNARYSPSFPQEPDRDVLEFMLTALMVRPVVDDSAILEIEKALRTVREQVEPEAIAGHAPFDRHAITRLAMAQSRLELRTSLDFDKGERRFFDLFREFVDLRGSFFKAGQETWAPAQVRTSFLEANLGPHDVDVLRALIRLQHESGQTWIPLSEIAAEIGDDLRADEVRQSLSRLVLGGRVLQSNNETLFRPLILD